ncbi:hypothetical protein DOK76_07075 [Vagococcus sp. DIV0080]|uniref:3-dehydroquinate synthase domain-containing protein n=1 Tax=Candidatus Vagococcus giribetii TaxID=2230876 RepID=A0ABS3HVF3_9ENTE|nr:hypothetical protein [Vagococcus sp. DIV0080]MBO0476826.1 hypothetical protein [Vagococcus sp. DIV0080]
MKKTVIKQQQSCDITYNKALNRLMTQDYFAYLNDTPCVLFISTQSFYELYYDKFASLIKESDKFYWYLCPDNESINFVKTYNKILVYIEEMKLPVDTSIVSAGNDHLYHLCGALKQTSPYISDFTYLPTSITGFIASLQGKAYLLNQSLTISVEQYVLPDRLVYDTMLNELETKNTWSDDLFNVAKLGVLTNKDLLKLLSREVIETSNRSWAPFLELIIESLEQETTPPVFMLSNISKSFYQLHEAHYLLPSEKEQISFLLFLLWNLKKAEITFDFEGFMKWLYRNGTFNFRLPIQMTTYDIAKVFVDELHRLDQIPYLTKIGDLGVSKAPSIEEMYHVVESYRKIKL